MTERDTAHDPGALVDLDRVVHEPARLMILALLYVLESSDFLFILRQTRLTQGNLSSHLAKLEDAGYVEVEKKFEGKRPTTSLRLTEAGRAAFKNYRRRMEHLFRTLPE